VRAGSVAAEEMGYLIQMATITVAATVLLASVARADQAKKAPLQVFVLAGQSNMEGQGKIASNPKRTAAKERWSTWFTTRPRPTASSAAGQGGQMDRPRRCWIWYLGRKGNLTVGYGAKEDRIGPELGFAW